MAGLARVVVAGYPHHITQRRVTASAERRPKAESAAWGWLTVSYTKPCRARLAPPLFLTRRNQGDKYKWQVLTEYNGSGVFQRWFAYGNYIDEVLATGISYLPIPGYYIHDHLYSPAALTNWLGTVLERYEYDAYGNPTIWNADLTAERANSNYGNPYLFTGRRVDILDSGSLKIQYNRNRYYDYYSGRWLTHDPLGITPNPQLPNRFGPIGQYKDGMNVYEYTSSNPVNKFDMFGTRTCDFDLRDGVLRAPIGDIVGRTEISIWYIHTGVMGGDCTGDCWKLHVTCCAQVIMWSLLSDDPVDSQGNSSHQHEIKHAEIYEKWWTFLEKLIDSFTSSCMCMKKVKCYGDALSKFSSAYKLMAGAQSAMFDCRVYLDEEQRAQKCEEADEEFDEANKALNRAHKQKRKCDKM